MGKTSNNYERQAAAMRDYFDSRGMRFKDVAEILGISPTTISNILSGHDSLGKKRSKMFADAFGFDISFLITGEGELFPPRPTINQSIVGENNTQVAEVGGNGGDCPSMADLLAKVASLERINKAKDSEITFLRNMINRLIPGQKLQDNGNE